MGIKDFEYTLKTMKNFRPRFFTSKFFQMFKEIRTILCKLFLIIKMDYFPTYFIIPV